MDATDALIRLAMVPGLGPRASHQLLAQAAHPAEIFTWSMDRLQAIGGISGELAFRICDPRGEERLTTEKARCHQARVAILTSDHPAYPRDLTRLGDPPVALWMRGAIEPRDRLAIAIAGPRRPSSYAHRQAQRLGSGLARIGTCLVAGLGRGVDTVVHEAALDHEGRTLAVLPGGLGRLYPEENRPLAERIVNGRGALISEFPLDAAAHAGHFPQRNRLIAALVLAVLVVESPPRSGAIALAREVSDLGGHVLALPGPIDQPGALGSNRLIRDGATLITGLDDVLEEVGPLATLAGGQGGVGAAPASVGALNNREQQVYRMLDHQPRTVADLARVCALPPSTLAATLVSLELRHLVRHGPQGYTHST